jgi:putative ABC transport system substrate-binding protein
MNRREVITLLGGAAAAWPGAVAAQQRPTKIIGLLHGESLALLAKPLESFREGLRETGYREGQNVAIEYRLANSRNDQLPALAADLVRRHVSVIVAPGTTPGALAAKGATATIPVVFFTAGNPVALGLVTSLSRPGGNITGTTSLGSELAPKRLELLRELLPSMTGMALLVNPTNPALANPTTHDVLHAAGAFGVQIHVLNASTEAEFDSVFAELARLRVGALVIMVDSFFTSRRELLGSLAFRHQIPAIYQYRDFAAAGGLMSYGGSLTEPYRLVGHYTGRILNGEKPADLPVQQVTKVELIINVRVARVLGLTVPAALLARADEVIE